MKNLNNKCFATSAVVHLSLFALLVLGVGFRASDSSIATSKSAKEGAKASTVELVDVPENGEPAPAQPKVPAQPLPAIVPTTPPSSPQAPASVALPSAQAQPAPAHRRPLPNISTIAEDRPAQRSVMTAPRNTTGGSSEARSKAISDLIGSALKAMPSAPGVRINLDGNGGTAKVLYQALVRDAYSRAWSAPALDSQSMSPVSGVKVTIARDGTILSAKLIKPSGNSVMDASVERALRSVTRIEPFEADSADTERTFTINFNLDLRRLE
jgi:TonB family protein